jgi:uncharacterized protein (DUF2267 family)
MALKAVYVDRWKFSRPFSRVSHLDDFLEEVRQEDAGMAGYDFGNDTKAGIAVAAVFRVLSHFVSEGEMNDIMGVMPAEIKEFIRESIIANKTII